MGQMFSYSADQIKLPSLIPNYDNQSKALKGADATRISRLNDNDVDLLKTADPDVATIYDNFLKGKRIAGGNGECLGYRPTADSEYKWLTYDHVNETAKAFGSALVNLDQRPGEETLIGFYAQNRPEWVMASLGSVTQGMVIVPLYDTLGVEAVQFILNQTSTAVVVCDTVKRAKLILDNADKFDSVEHLIVMDETTEDLKHDRIVVHSFEEIVQSGKDRPQGMHLPQADDLYMLCFTSGTTGNPKGAMLTHGNLVAFASSLAVLVDKFGLTRNSTFGPGQSVISYLPLAHSFEQVIETSVFQYGMKIGFFRGNVATLLDDCKALKPTVFPVVPRLLNKLYDKVQANLAKAGGVSRWLFQRAYNYKLALLKQGVVTKHCVWDRLVFKKIQEELGGAVEFMAVGAAPISEEVLTMCRVALGCVLVEGYGQTESTAACTVTLPGDWVAGSVGAPLSCTRVKLDDIADMEYWAKDNKGEICIMGPSVMRGYYKEEAKTREAIDDEGWLHTGDVGTWLPNGTLKIIDRKKHIFKLAQGEYVAPEKIENVFALMPLIAQIFVDGSSLQRYLVAIVVPDETATREWFKNNMGGEKTASASMADLCSDAQFKTALLAQMEAHGKTHKLNSIERPKDIYVSSEPFSVENNLLTPTFKTKRPQLRTAYKTHMERMYEETNRNAETVR